MQTKVADIFMTTRNKWLEQAIQCDGLTADGQPEQKTRTSGIAREVTTDRKSGGKKWDECIVEEGWSAK